MIQIVRSRNASSEEECMTILRKEVQFGDACANDVACPGLLKRHLFTVQICDGCHCVG